MAILTQSGRAAMAAAIADQPLHLAWGSGDPAWDTTPQPEPTSATTLVNEIGRRTVTQVQFVVPDPGGTIVVPTGRFNPSPGNAPTNHLYLRFNFDFEDAPAATIREVGVFVGTEFDPALPPGQRYFAPADIVQSGILLALERIPKFDRSPAVRQNFETVITV